MYSCTPVCKNCLERDCENLKFCETENESFSNIISEANFLNEKDGDHLNHMLSSIFNDNDVDEIPDEENYEELTM